MNMNTSEEMKDPLIKNEDKGEDADISLEEDDLNKMNRISESINEEEQSPPINEGDHEKPYTNLSNIPANVPIESLLGEDFLLVPNSTRRALIAKWDQGKKRHVLKEKEMKQLEDKNLLDTWENTANAIAADKRKQPMNNFPPLCIRMIWASIRLLFLLLLLYIEFVVVQVFLMNIVIIGICIWMHLKIMIFTNGMYKNKMYSYRHRDFKRFLQDEKEKYGSVELIPGKEGKWIEIKLEEDENDSLGDNFNPYNNPMIDSLEESKKAN
mmetsp:Transcript_11089/g.12547  ORF Transcript_11089/g.12547 Transcript_11089/m.12547 type:complete len:268 (+) Transcript_11089:22-825(+)